MILRRIDRRVTGADGVAIHDDGASAALRQTAAKLRAVHAQIVSQDIEKRGIQIGVHYSALAIHVQGEFCLTRLLLIEMN